MRAGPRTVEGVTPTAPDPALVPTPAPAPAAVASGPPVVVVVDDLRRFPHIEAAPVQLHYARTLPAALALLERLAGAGTAVAELWLDHDLGPGTGPGGHDDVLPVLAWMEERCHLGQPLEVGLVVVHTSNPPGAARIVSSLGRWYPLRRVDAAAFGCVQL